MKATSGRRQITFSVVHPVSILTPSSREGAAAIVGAGRVGRAAALAFRSVGYRVTGPSRRGESVARVAVVLLCVPDREIAAASGQCAAPGISSGIHRGNRNR